MFSVTSLPCHFRYMMMKEPFNFKDTIIQQFITRFEVWEEAFPILHLIVEPRDVELIVAMKGQSWSLESLAKLTDQAPSDILPVLERSYQRNLLDKTRSKGVCYYQQTSFATRLDHFVKYEEWQTIPQATRKILDRRCLADYASDQREAVKRKQAGDVSASETINDSVLLLSELADMLEQAKIIALQPCNCRLFGQNCNQTLEVCLSLDQEAEDILSRGKGKRLTAQEAKDLVSKADKDGLMHTGDANWQKNGLKAICNCCACDCYPFRAANILDSKGVWPESRYLAVVHPEACNHCGTCIKRCQFGAFVKHDETVIIKGKKRNKVVYDPGKCWGCGLCANTCKKGAIVMEPIPTTSF